MVDYETKNFLGVLLRLRGSVLPQLLGRIFVCAALGAGAVWMFDEWGVKIPGTVHAMLGVALGLLLVFRTSASYDRYWEGRRLLGMLVNRSRDLQRQATAFIDGDGDEARADRAEVQRLVVAFFALLRQYLRSERDLGKLGATLTDAERAALEPVAVRPNLAVAWLTQRLAACLRAGRLSERALEMMDLNVTSMVDSWGGAERIMKTPIPFAYAQHIKAFLSLFCFTAPLALVESLRWGTPLAAAVLAFGMFGIEQIGVEIEDPFGYDANDLPVDAIGDVIARDTRAILATRDPASE